MPEKRKREKTTARPKASDAEIKRIKALLRNRPPFRDERLAPAIDHALLLALVRDELPERTSRAVYRFIISFKSWSDAYCDLLVREYRATQGAPSTTR
ncbi:MAG: hypothetical protein WD894_11410 [Pirellulales bacterium]